MKSGDRPWIHVTVIGTIRGALLSSSG